MRLKINKDGKQTVYTMINSWSDVTLDKWVKLISKKEKIFRNLLPHQKVGLTIYGKR